jgi:hypothetical protein
MLFLNVTSLILQIIDGKNWDKYSCTIDEDNTIACNKTSHREDLVVAIVIASICGGMIVALVVVKILAGVRKKRQQRMSAVPSHHHVEEAPLEIELVET